MSTRSLAWISGVIFTLFLSGLWLLMDDPLDAKADTALNIHIRPITNDNGFIYLLGLDAQNGNDCYSLGKNRLIQYRQWLKSPIIMMAPTFNGVQSFRAPLWFDGSDEQLIARAKDLPYVIASNPNLYSRYHTFLQFKEFDTLIHFDVSTTEALSEGLVIGNRFLRADVLSKALTDSAPQAAALLIADINAWRRQLQLADNISHKLLAARLLANDFSLITILTQKKSWPADTLALLINVLGPLSLQEISFERSLLHAEFSKIGYALLDAKNNLAILNMPKSSFLPLAFSYKPNMSVNFLYDQYSTIANENNLPPRQLSHTLQEQTVRETNIPFTQWIKNPVGITAVQNLLTINFKSYTARLWDIDVNRLLTQLVLEATKQQLNTEDALNIFIQKPMFHGIWDNKPPHYSPDKTHLCYDGPTDDKKMLRCINIGWLLHKTR